MPRPTPYEKIIAQARSEGALPDEVVGSLPSRWEFLGDVLSIKLPGTMNEYGAEIGALYARVLKVKTVICDVGGIVGTTRAPAVEILYGHETETVHVENGIRYHMDAARVMFASGNIDERMRAAKLDCDGQNVLDMFAGIGYFTLPVARYTGPSRVISCEINPVAGRYLRTNLRANGVEELVEVREGDCRDVAPAGWAHRVFMGYLHDTHEFLPHAFRALSAEGGTIHYHEICPSELVPGRVKKRVDEGARAGGYTLAGSDVRKVKSYAPGVWHVVMDARCMPLL